MPPDQGCYEERYRLTFPVARSVAFSLKPLIIAIFSHQPLPWVILAPVIFVLATVPWLVGLAAVWLLWRPASGAFFKPRDFTQAGSGA